eukprot:Cvel_29848.t1-p1 / transcript=Cvel_29848.t1 / gene=Cvel_29848 / organism=Chromera_velia_CCMP2878 / gene_product=hypothetical protein / transcript_product=hypothetical protein / location=Cvel_scaffold4162:30-1450(-) / protein_length=294 / sequence_SO=supercontig / SO=protein_coding / is_pseudo=false
MSCIQGLRVLVGPHVPDSVLQSCLAQAKGDLARAANLLLDRHGVGVGATGGVGGNGSGRLKRPFVTTGARELVRDAPKAGASGSSSSSLMMQRPDDGPVEIPSSPEVMKGGQGRVSKRVRRSEEKEMGPTDRSGGVVEREEVEEGGQSSFVTESFEVFLGKLVVEGYATDRFWAGRGSGLSCGCPADFRLEVPPPRAVGGRGRGRGGGAIAAMEKKNKSKSNNAASPADTLSDVIERAARNGTIRFSLQRELNSNGAPLGPGVFQAGADGRESGKLPASAGRVLAPLMALGVVQ